MRSLRRSLTLYFLALVAVGVGAVAVFADQMISRSLEEKQEAVAEAIDLRAAEKAKATKEHFDEELLGHARSLGSVLQLQYHQMWVSELTRLRQALLAAEVGTGATLNPTHFAVTWSCLAPGSLTFQRHRPFSTGLLFSLTRAYFKNLQLPNELYLQSGDGDDPHGPYIQVNSSSGNMWRTPELGSVVFKNNLVSTSADVVIDWNFDIVQLPTGEKGRRVALKTSLGDRGFSPISRGGGPPRPSKGPPPPPPQDREPKSPSRPPNPDEDVPKGRPSQDREPVPQRAIYIHCAVALAPLTAGLQSIESDRSAAQTTLAERIHSERTRFRIRIAGVGLATFIAILIGGPLVIARGLSPVKKLSKAVSAVSERDFRLPIRQEDLSRELLPIHARLSQTLDELRRAFAREKQAVADISHELRTPLAGLLASMEVSLRKPRTSEQYKSTIEECRIIAKELARLVERILALAALDSGRTAIHTARIDAYEIVESCASVIRPLVKAHDLTLKVDAVPNVELDIDADKLRDILMNLLHNAIEYNRPHGSIHLRLRTTMNHAVFEVQDTGIGMTPEIREHIFERFFRADASRHATGVHAGLGLSLVKEYVGRLGGTITVESEPMIGTTMRVRFPLATDPDGEDATERTSQSIGATLRGLLW